MKLTCDLCGGILQMNPGGKGATCVDCGLTYTIEHLREKLGVKSDEKKEEKKEEVKYVPHDEIEIEMPDECKEEEVVYEGEWEKADEDVVYEGEWEKAVPDYDINGTLISWDDIKPVPSDKFMMTVMGKNNLKGKVVSGYVKIGDTVYINGMKSNSAKVTFIDKISKNPTRLDDFMECASKGDELYINLDAKLKKKDMAAVSSITGEAAEEDYFPEDMYGYWGTLKEYFSEVFLRYLSEYDVFRDCTLFEENYPVSFAVCKDGEIKLAILFYESSVNGDQKLQEKIIGKCEREGIPAIRFFDSYRNNSSYIVERVRASAKA